MRIHSSIILVFIVSLMNACGQNLEVQEARVPPSELASKSPPDSDPDKGSNSEKSPDGMTQIKPQKVCYYTPDSANENCVKLFEPTAQHSKKDYAYIDPFRSSSFPRNFEPHQYIAPSRYLSLKEVDGGIHLTKHFKVGELMQLFKGELALFSPDALYNIERMRRHIAKPIVVSSGYRSPGYNSGLNGSAQWSRHMYGDAIDFRIKGMNFKAIAELCLTFGASFYQIYTSHIHCDWRNTPLNAGFYDAVVKNNKFVNYKHQAERHSHINIEEINGKWKLSTEIPIEDNEADLSYEWEVMDSEQKLKLYKKPIIELNKSKKYQVKVTIGGSIELETTVP